MTHQAKAARDTREQLSAMGYGPKKVSVRGSLSTHSSKVTINILSADVDGDAVVEVARRCAARFVFVHDVNGRSLASF